MDDDSPFGEINFSDEFFRPKPGCLICEQPHGGAGFLHRVPVDCYTQDDVDRWNRQEREAEARHAAAECKICDDRGYLWDDDCRCCGEYGRGGRRSCPACMRGALDAWAGLAPNVSG